jgi:hypothetical protein
MLQSPMTIIWITFTTDICTINTKTIGTSALLMVALSTLNMSTSMARTADMWPFLTEITWTTYTTDTFTLPTATTGTSTN